MKKRLGNFEIVATGYQKGTGADSAQVPVSSVVSRHHHYSQAHQHLVQNMGAEKSGLGAKAVFTKGNLSYHISPVFPKDQKKKAAPKQKAKLPMKEELNENHVRIVLEAVKKARLRRMLEDHDKPNTEVKDDEDTDDDSGTKDVLVKGNKTLTGEKPDKINTDPELPTVVIPKGAKPSVMPQN